MAIATAPNVAKDGISKPDLYRGSEMEAGPEAWELLKRAWMTKGPAVITLPVDPIELSEKCGIKVLLDDALAPEVSGVLHKQPGFSDPTILLNAVDSRARQRFTRAHAIGDAEETYATEFAAELLMPRAVFRELDGTSTVASLVGLFGVTADVVGFRLDHIGWSRR